MTYRQPFTSESVTEGHPDKVCDRISDSILDALLAQDPTSRVAVETMVTTGLVHVAGEVTTESYVEIPHLVRETICEIGYTSSRVGFDGNSAVSRCQLVSNLRISPGEWTNPLRRVRAPQLSTGTIARALATRA